MAQRTDNHVNHPPDNPLVERITVEPTPRHVQMRLGGEIIADSNRALTLRESGLPPVLYFPMEDVRMDLLQPTTHRTHCPYKGDASYWTVRAGGKVAENAAWAYRDPLPTRVDIKDHIAFYQDRMDD
jgi:uncharacterized protein (DUF427 family)